MGIKGNVLIQTGAVIGQVANMALPILPPKYQGWALIALAVAQAVAAGRAQYRNPDGTSARVAWRPADDRRIGDGNRAPETR